MVLSKRAIELIHRPLEFRDRKPEAGRIPRFLYRSASPISCRDLKGLELARFLRPMVSFTRN